MGNPGTMTTAGNLVFQGRVNGELVAYDATSGKVLWIFDTGLGISAPPVTYAVNGKQYVAILVGWGSGFAALGGNTSVANGWAYERQTRRLVAFSLEGRAELPPQAQAGPEKAVAMLQFEINEELAEQGSGEFGRCVVCHGFARRVARHGAGSARFADQRKHSPTWCETAAVLQTACRGTVT